MSIEELKEIKKALGVKTDKELAEIIGIDAKSVNVYRYRGVPSKIKLFVEERIKNQQNQQGEESLGLKETTSAKLDSHQNLKENHQHINIRYYPHVHASAGYGVVNSDLGFDVISFEKSLLMGIRVQNLKNLEIIQVYGDSMLPFICDGDKALIERDCEAKNGDVVIANIHGDIYIKQIQKDPLGRWVRLISSNQDYGNIVLENEEMESLIIVGVVRATYKVKVY